MGWHDPLAARVKNRANCHVLHGVNPITTIDLLAGDKGINASGTVVEPVIFQYKLFYRGHGDSLNRRPVRGMRQFMEIDVCLAFATSDISYNPVVTAGKNPAVPSLISTYTTATLVNCTECHNNSQGIHAGGAGTTGPNGSTYVPLLERRRELTDFQAESYDVYALRYKCQSHTSILSDASFLKHNLHVAVKNTACTTCHDPDCVATVPRLINFNINYVTPYSGDQMRFEANARLCFLTFHGADHNPKFYKSREINDLTLTPLIGSVCSNSLSRV